jgi:hypothetical protein
VHALIRHHQQMIINNQIKKVRRNKRKIIDLTDLRMAMDKTFQADVFSADGLKDILIEVEERINDSPYIGRQNILTL